MLLQVNNYVFSKNSDIWIANSGHRYGLAKAVGDYVESSRATDAVYRVLKAIGNTGLLEAQQRRTTVNVVPGGVSRTRACWNTERIKHVLNKHGLWPESDVWCWSVQQRGLWFCGGVATLAEHLRQRGIFVI